MKSVNAPLVRGRLLEVAAHIFAAEGAGALTVRRLATELGTSTMSLYSHFSGKDQLIEATADEFVVRFAEALQSVPVTDDALFDFVSLANTYRSISLVNRDLYRVAMASGRLSITRDTPTGMQGMFDYCANAVARCIAQGSLRADDARAGLMVFWTAVHGQVTLEMEQVFPTAQAGQKAWESCFRALLIGMGASPDRAGPVLERARKSSGSLPRASSRAASGVR